MKEGYNFITHWTDEISSGTEESNSMHDYWEEAALKEWQATNDYE